MALSHFTIGGYRVPWSDFIMTLRVTCLADCRAFCEANRSRIGTEAGSGNKPKKLDRHARAGTEDPEDCKILLVLTFSNPPGESRSQFVLGRDPKHCDIVCDHRQISSKHIKFGFDGDHVVLYDVSSRGSRLSIGGRGYQKTCPLPGVPYKCILPPGPKIKLKIPCFEIEIGLAGRRGPELQEFRERRDAFLASCCDLEALTLESTLATEIATKSHTARPPEWRAMYWFESRLGEGGCGTVHKVRRLTDWAVFAAKEVVGRRSNSGFRREIDILQRLRHHRIVEYVDCYPDTQENTILVMEYCQFGSLDQMLRATPGVLALRTTAEVLKQVAEGLLYLHGKGVTHRDLKPANILVRSQTPLSLVLSDFGLAKDEEIMETYCGTPQFLAPEMFEGVGYTKAIDIWALGVIGILLLEGQLPEMEKFGNSMYPNTLFEKAAQMYAKDPKNRLVILVRQMLAMHPEDRPPAEDCVRDTEYALRNWGPCQPTAAAQVPSIGSGPIDTQVQEDDSDRTLRPSELHTSEGQTLQPAKEEVAHDSGDNGHEQPAQDGESTDARSEPSSCATVTQRSVRKRNRESLSRSNSMDRTARKLLRTEDGQSEDGRAV